MGSNRDRIPPNSLDELAAHVDPDIRSAAQRVQIQDRVAAVQDQIRQRRASQTAHSPIGTPVPPMTSTERSRLHRARKGGK